MHDCQVGGIRDQGQDIHITPIADAFHDPQVTSADPSGVSSCYRMWGRGRSGVWGGKEVLELPDPMNAISHSESGEVARQVYQRRRPGIPRVHGVAWSNEAEALRWRSTSHYALIPPPGTALPFPCYCSGRSCSTGQSQQPRDGLGRSSGD